MSKTVKGILFLLLASFLYSVMPILVRFLTAEKVPPISQVFLRYIFAFSAALVYFLTSKTKFIFKRKTLPLLIGISIFGYALTNLFYTYSMIYTKVTTATFIFYSYSILTPLLAVIFLKEKANRFNFFGLGLSLLALLLLFQPNSIATWKIGGLFALLTALGQSIYLVGRRKLINISSQQILLSSTFFGVVTLGIMALIFDNAFYFGTGGVRTINGQTWLVTALFGLDNFSAWFFMSKGFQLVKAATGSLIMLVENVFLVILSLVFLKEIPTMATIIGGLIILGTIALVTVKGDKS